MRESCTDFITFNPGPSQIAPKILQGIRDISQSGFLSMSHRSEAFIEMSRKAIEGLRFSMSLPPEYRIFYQPSATSAMDALLRNLVFKKSYHFVNGHFSSVFYHSAVGIGLDAGIFDNPLDQPIAWEKAEISPDVELIALTHNETSTGSMWPQADLDEIRRRHPNILIANDVTSSFGAMRMNWENADVFFGSVQKNLGLPAGLGILIISPRAYEKSLEVIAKKKGISPLQRFDKLAEMMHSYQTPETPNMFAIALLALQMSDWDLGKIESEVRAKAERLYANSDVWKPYIQNKAWQSCTVLNVVVESASAWHAKAKEQGILLGHGYGRLKDTCIRLATFPALSMEAIGKLIDFSKTIEKESKNL